MCLNVLLSFLEVFRVGVFLVYQVIEGGDFGFVSLFCSLQSFESLGLGIACSDIYIREVLGVGVLEFFGVFIIRVEFREIDQYQIMEGCEFQVEYFGVEVMVGIR